jgi:hypothetical protein
MSSINRAALLLAGTLLAASACNGSGAVPPAASGAASASWQASGAFTSLASGADTTSILKKLKKDVIIGTTVDPTNGDMGARSISTPTVSYGKLSKGQLVVCNFEDKAGTAGDGTTVDVFDAKPNSSPSTFAKSTKIEGCDADAVTTGDSVFAAGLTSGLLADFDEKGSLKKTYGPPFKAPFSNVDASNPHLYSAEYIFTSDASTGSIVSFSINRYGQHKRLEVATGFAVNGKTGWSALGPSGVAYRAKSDTLYIADGVDNTVVAFTHASELLVPDEIMVEPGGKTFKCKYPSTTCGVLIYAGKPLDAPVAMTLLPNGNLIVANTQGGNTLVELSAAGKVLDTKVVDKSKTAGIFGLLATGTNDSNTKLFFTDTNPNNLQELEP